MSHPDTSGGGEHHAGPEGCHPLALYTDPLQLSQRGPGDPVAIIAFLLGVVWIFDGVFILCYTHFDPILERIIEITGLTHDQAGVLILAPGSSAPEFVTGMLGESHLSRTHN